MPEKTNNADNRIKQLFSGFSYACDTNENNLRRILRDNKDAASDVYKRQYFIGGGIFKGSAAW